MADRVNIHHQLQANPERITVITRYGPVVGGKAHNGAIVFLEIPYALPPKRFEDPDPLPERFRYPDTEFIRQSGYAVQPLNDGQAAGIPFETKVGVGKPTENPLFLNIYIPPSFPSKTNFRVKVYIHGGFLQFGSPHTLNSQGHYIAAERSEIWVTMGYRLSALGFLASPKRGLTGNYGFKDQWLALEWVKANIHDFGGNPDDIQLSGHSAGAYSVHQILHHVSILPPGEPAPFTSAVLHSGAIVTECKMASELEAQFDALCQALGLDPNATDIVTTLKDPIKVPWSSITRIIETETLGKNGTFRGCLSNDWTIVSPSLMPRQRRGGLSRSLLDHGVRYLLLGYLTQEWYLYSIAHTITSAEDIMPNLERYFSPAAIEKLMSHFGPLEKDADLEKVKKRFGEMLSVMQVYMPVQALAGEMKLHKFPVIRYEIGWTPESVRAYTQGFVTHGTDRAMWTLHLPSLTQDEAQLARAWLDRIDAETVNLQKGLTPIDITLKIFNDKRIGWAKAIPWAANNNAKKEDKDVPGTSTK